MRRTLIALCALSITILAACGGGGDKAARPKGDEWRQWSSQEQWVKVYPSSARSSVDHERNCATLQRMDERFIRKMNEFPEDGFDRALYDHLSDYAYNRASQIGCTGW